jgi:hypothetical protein
LSPSASTRSTTTTAETVSSMHSPGTERQFSLRSTQDDSSSGLPTPSGQSILAFSDVNAMRSAAIMPTHPRAESVPVTTAIYDPQPSPTSLGSADDGNPGNYSSRHGTWFLNPA